MILSFLVVFLVGSAGLPIYSCGICVSGIPTVLHDVSVGSSLWWVDGPWSQIQDGYASSLGGVGKSHEHPHKIRGHRCRLMPGSILVDLVCILPA